MDKCRHYDVLKNCDRVNLKVVLQTPTLREFDRVATCKFFGYKTVDDYYSGFETYFYVISKILLFSLCSRCQFYQVYPQLSAFFFVFLSIYSKFDLMSDVKVPLLCINSRDDPLVTESSLPFREAQKNPNLFLGLTFQ